MTSLLESSPILRRWSADDSEDVLLRRERRFSIACRRCRKYVEATLSIRDEQADPHALPRAEEMAERAFALEHPRCPGEQSALST